MFPKKKPVKSGKEIPRWKQLARIISEPKLTKRYLALRKKYTKEKAVDLTLAKKKTYHPILLAKILSNPKLTKQYLSLRKDLSAERAIELTLESEKKKQTKPSK